MNGGKILDEAKDIKIKEVNFKISAVQRFKCGSIIFLPDYNFDAYVINSVPGQISYGLVVWYEGVQKNLDLLITQIFKINDLDQIDAQYEVCPLQESLILYEKKSGVLIGTNYDTPGETKITVPVLVDEKYYNKANPLQKLNYIVDKFVCSQDAMYFQILVTDT